MSKKVIIIASVLSLVILASSFWYFKENSATENENIKGKIESNDVNSWKTYSDIDLEFTIQYPSVYLAKKGLVEASFDPYFYIKNPKINENRGVSNVNALDLNYVPNFLGGNDGRAKNPEEWIAIAMEGAGKNGNPKSYAKTIIDGEVAYISDEESDGVPQKEYTVFRKKGEWYDLYAFRARKDDVGEKILSTLMFYSLENSKSE